MIPKPLAQVFAMALLIVACCEARAAETVALYQLVLDMNRDGVGDRAVLAVERSGSREGDAPGEFYRMEEGETAVLLVYLGGGGGPFNPSRPPDLRATTLVDPERTSFLYPLEEGRPGSLKLSAAELPGSSHSLEETLTLIHRHGAFAVAGLTTAWENPGGIGNCDLNLLPGVGVMMEGEVGGPTHPVKTRAGGVRAETWSPATRPAVCDQPEK